MELGKGLSLKARLTQALDLYGPLPSWQCGSRSPFTSLSFSVRLQSKDNNTSLMTAVLFTGHICPG